MAIDSFSIELSDGRVFLFLTFGSVHSSSVDPPSLLDSVGVDVTLFGTSFFGATCDGACKTEFNVLLRFGEFGWSSVKLSPMLVMCERGVS